MHEAFSTRRISLSFYQQQAAAAAAAAGRFLCPPPLWLWAPQNASDFRFSRRSHWLFSMHRFKPRRAAEPCVLFYCSLESFEQAMVMALLPRCIFNRKTCSSWTSRILESVLISCVLFYPPESARRKPNGLISSQSNKKSLTSKFFGHTNTSSSSSSETPRSSACLRPPDTDMLRSRLPRSLQPRSKGNR